MFGAFFLYLLLCLGALLFNRSLNLGTSTLDLLLASVLLPSESERDAGERERDYEKLQPIPGWFSTELSKRPRLTLPRWFVGISSPSTLAGFLLLLHGCSLFLHGIISYSRSR
jgi:hypothetical protein